MPPDEQGSRRTDDRHLWTQSPRQASVEPDARVRPIGRDPAKLKPFIPLTPNAFVLQGSLGEWLFVVDKNGRAAHILSFRKFEPLVWSRVAD